ncbi:MAG: hypothetical protein K2X77_07840, partial [Candidatus Obscuribacterales bacterium]|nr:hypothetical protein [Candidatus Obscuribacterales bacterium]
RDRTESRQGPCYASPDRANRPQEFEAGKMPALPGSNRIQAGRCYASPDRANRPQEFEAGKMPALPGSNQIAGAPRIEPKCRRSQDRTEMPALPGSNRIPKRSNLARRR